MFTGLVEDTGITVAGDRPGEAMASGVRRWRIELAAGESVLGDRSNLEVDILAKHVEKLVSQ